MTDIDTAPLLAPVADDAPSGPDLSYDPDFQALEQMALGKSEQQFGDTVIPAEEPDWRDVRERAEALLLRTKDVRVAVLYARSITWAYQIEGLAVGLDFIRELLDRYWDTMHPELDREDNDDPTMRLNALGPLADPETFLREIRNTVVAASPQHGRVCVRDVLIATGKLPAGAEVAPSAAQISGILRGVADENPAPLQAALASAQAVKALESLLSDKGVITQAPDLRPLNDMLHAVTPMCAAVLGTTEEGVEDASGAAPGEEGRPRVPGQIQNRDDAVRMLETVCRFIELSEPSNPAPLLIRRAQRLMSRSFLEIIQDLSPESLAQIQKLAGMQQESDPSA